MIVGVALGVGVASIGGPSATGGLSTIKTCVGVAVGAGRGVEVGATVGVRVGVGAGGRVAVGVAVGAVVGVGV